MNVNYSKTDDVHGLITVSIEASDYAPKVAEQLKQIGKKHAEPGFRPGKTPKSLIEKKYGKAVKYDVVNEVIGSAVYDYLTNSDIRVLGNPMPAPGENFDLDAENYSLSFIVGVSPEINTHVDKDLHIPYYKIEVSDKMVDDQSESLRLRFGKQVPGEEMEAGAVVKGVLTQLDENGKVKEDGLVVENGVLSPKYFNSEEQRKLFDGKKPGDEVVFNPWATCEGNPAELSSMLEIDKDQVDNYKGDFLMSIKEIIVLRPADMNQELFDAVFGPDKVHNEEEWRNAIKEMLAGQLVGDSNYKFSLDAKKDVLAAVGDVVLPDDVLKHFLKSRNEALNDENIEAEYEKVRPEIVWEVVQGAILSQYNVKLDEEAIKDLARVITRQQLAQYGITNLPAEALDQYSQKMLDDEKMRSRLEQQAIEMKLYDTIRENVTLDEKTVSVEDFNKLFEVAEA